MLRGPCRLHRGVVFLTLTLLLVLLYRSWQPQMPLLRPHGPTAEQIRTGQNILPDLRKGRTEWRFREPVINASSPYPVGKTKPAGSRYTKSLVVASLSTEDTKWIDVHLKDMQESGLLTKAVYVVDQRNATLKVPRNKGHEAMVYLTYIIDHYDTLSDVTMFMHAHRFAWHNDELLEKDAVQMIRRLSPERVTRLGYMNLRCHWEPGCPSWLHPHDPMPGEQYEEEIYLANVWQHLFPTEPLPEVVAQPCCAQFAVSRDRIRALPRQKYIDLRDWLLRTRLSDYFSGRVFEYTWQFIFSLTPVDCPSMSVCYCDGYGMCFGGPKEFDAWFELRYMRDDLIESLKLWQKLSSEESFLRWTKNNYNPDVVRLAGLTSAKRKVELAQLIERYTQEMQSRLQQALERGANPRLRALEAGREWHEGDGF